MCGSAIDVMPLHTPFAKIFYYYVEGFSQNGLYPPVENYRRIEGDCYGHDVYAHQYKDGESSFPLAGIFHKAH